MVYKNYLPAHNVVSVCHLTHTQNRMKIIQCPCGLKSEGLYKTRFKESEYPYRFYWEWVCGDCGQTFIEFVKEPIVL